MRGLQWLDWSVIGGYGLFMIGLGLYYSRGQKTTEDYFLAGRRTGSLVAGISLFATLLSTISYLAMPGELIQNGPIVLLGSAAVFLAYPIVGYVLIPAVMRVPVTSAYELLELRLGHDVRMLGSAIFMATRIVWMALLMHLSSKAFVVMMGWETHMVFAVIWALGLIAIVYTMLGGLRAVMITDVVQTAILLGGLLLTVGFITAHLGGPGAWWPTEWAAHWDEQPLISFSPCVRVTMFGSILYTFLFWACASISDQVTIQRYLATRDARTARRAFLVTSVADVLVSVALALTGFALLGFFHHHPELIPAGQSLSGDADYLFPYYIANFLPAGGRRAGCFGDRCRGDVEPRFRPEQRDHGPLGRLARHVWKEPAIRSRPVAPSRDDSPSSLGSSFWRWLAAWVTCRATCSKWSSRRSGYSSPPWPGCSSWLCSYPGRTARARSSARYSDSSRPC